MRDTPNEKGMSPLERGGVCLGGIAVLTGFLFAIGQLFGWPILVLNTREGPLAALQVHLTLSALGIALIAGVYAFGAYRKQEEQLELLKRKPLVVVSWPTKPSDLPLMTDVSRMRAFYTLPEKDSQRLVPIPFQFENQGLIPATCYNLDIVRRSNDPQLLMPTTWLVWYREGDSRADFSEIPGDGVYVRPFTTADDRLGSSWLVNADPHLVLPVGLPLLGFPYTLLQLEAQKAVTQQKQPLWFAFQVTFTDEWGMNGPYSLSLGIGYRNQRPPDFSEAL